MIYVELQSNSISQERRQLKSGGWSKFLFILKKSVREDISYATI